MSPDWPLSPEPVPFAEFDNPQTLNLYAYVVNNPLLKVDPDGHGGNRIRLDSQHTMVIHTADADQVNGHVFHGNSKQAIAKVRMDADGIARVVDGSLPEPVLQKAADKLGQKWRIAQEKTKHGVLGGTRRKDSGQSKIVVGLTVAQLVVDALAAYESQVNESKTGYHKDGFGQLVVSDLKKAAQSLDQGTGIEHSGRAFVLQNDGRWVDPLTGDELKQDEKGNFYTTQTRT
jgi:hypothetical protein